MVEIEIDGKKVEVTEGSMVMEAAHKLGTYIPHFCYHRKLSIAANCRMCLVEVEKAPKPLPACATPATPGMKVFTNSEKAVKAQKSVMEFLLINHPLDCPICDQGGECQLQDLAVGYGNTSSRYQEEKRVVFQKNVGPLISMQEMSRCIHCTRCVRFGQEIAGQMELGMLHRGEHSEITTFVGNAVNSELSGNMIDLCPVGALTSKPFRYQARTWELSRRKSVSAHDSLGSNLIVQSKHNQVLRVLPLENEAINECWISDRDRFAYEGLNSEDRLTKPMMKQDNVWREVDWQTALEYAGNGLQSIIREWGADAVEAVAAGHSTVEELYLLQKLIRALGSDNVDFRVRRSDFSAQPAGAQWLGLKIADVASLQRVLLVGSALRNDHPLFASRLRTAAKKGAQIHTLAAAAEDLLMPVANRITVAPSAWVAELAGIAAAVAQATNQTSPAGNAPVSEAATAIAKSLLAGDRKAVLLGNGAAAHPQFAQLHALAMWIANATGAKLGFTGEAANSVGGYIANALPQAAGRAPFAANRKAFVLLNLEPEADVANPAAARAALAGAETVIALTAYASPALLETADLLLPIAPYTETSGTFINCEGTVQSFAGAVAPRGEARPGWKVLRVLGTMLGLAGFDYDTPEAVRDAALAGGVETRLNNAAPLVAPVAAAPAAGLERIADVALYHSDAIVRRSASLQATATAKAAQAAQLPAALAAQLGVKDGEMVRVSQDGNAVIMPARVDAALAANTVRIAAGTPAAAQLGAMFGAVQIERA